MSERASQVRQRRVAGSQRNRAAISWRSGAEQATDERGPRENGQRRRGVSVRLREEVSR